MEDTAPILPGEQRPIGAPKRVGLSLSPECYLRLCALAAAGETRVSTLAALLVEQALADLDEGRSCPAAAAPLGPDEQPQPPRRLQLVMPMEGENAPF